MDEFRMNGPHDRWEWSQHYERFASNRYMFMGAGQRFHPPFDWEGFNDFVDFGPVNPLAAHRTWKHANKTGRLNADFETFMMGWYIPREQLRQLDSAMFLNRFHPDRLARINEWMKEIEQQTRDFKAKWGNR